MRAAPAVDYPVSQEGWWRRVAAALGGVVAGVPAAWLASHAALAPAALLLAAVPAAALGGWLGWRVSRVAAGSVCWDGGAWFHRAAPGAEPQPGQPELALDWGDSMLLRWRGPGTGRAVCIPLAQCDLPSRWHALRVALRSGGGGAA